MADTTFTNGTVVQPEWLQDVNDLVYDIPLSTGSDLVGHGSGTVKDALDDLNVKQQVNVNIFPNTNWYVGTSLSSGTKYNSNGTGTLAAISVSSYTTGSNVITCSTSDTTGLENGFLVAFNAPADSNMRITTARVYDIVTNTSFKVRLPLGLTASSSSACTATITEVGMAGSSGSGNGFDGWTKSSTLLVGRDSNNVSSGAKYSALMVKADAAAELYYVQFTAEQVKQLLGKTVTAGGFIKTTASGSWRVFTADSVNGTRYGSTTTGTGSFTWSEFSFTVPAAATTLSIGFELIGASGVPFYLCSPFAGQGTVIGSTGGSPSFNTQYIIPTVKYSPLSFTNANITFPASADSLGYYSFLFDAYAETNGALAPECKALHIILEGFNASAVITGTGGRHIASRDQEAIPHKYGPIMFQQVVDVKTSSLGNLTLSTTGTALFYGLASDNWANVSMDINGIIING